MELNKKTAIMVASAAPIRNLLKEIVGEADESTRYLAGKVSTQAVVNGLVLWLAAQPRDHRARVIDEALKLIAAVELDETRPSSINRSVSAFHGGRRASTSPSEGDGLVGADGFDAVQTRPSEPGDVNASPLQGRLTP